MSNNLADSYAGIPAVVSWADLESAIAPLFDLLGLSGASLVGAEPGVVISDERITFSVATDAPGSRLVPVSVAVDRSGPSRPRKMCDPGVPAFGQVLSDAHRELRQIRDELRTLNAATVDGKAGRRK